MTIPRHDPARTLGTTAPQVLVESGCLNTSVKLSLNPPVPLLLYFMVVVTAISYFQRSVKRSAVKNMETPMTVGEKFEKQKGRKKKKIMKKISQ